jgi:hypothetical protein
MTRRPFVTVTKTARRISLVKPSSEWLPKERIEAMPKGKPDPIAFAHFWLGGRLEERDGAFYLDDKPAKLDQVMRAANGMARQNGRAQITINPAWLP